jgi:hypothetical protein
MHAVHARHHREEEAMKKISCKKMTLAKETLLDLSRTDLRAKLEAAWGRGDVDTGTCTCAWTDTHPVCCA